MTHSGHGGYHGPTQQHFVQGQSAQIPGQLGYGPSPVAPPEYTNVALLPGEQTLFAGDFTASPILRHIKTGVVVTRERIIVRQPQYLFYFVKTGYAESSSPLRQLSQLTTGRLLSPWRVRAAVITGGAGFFVLMMGMSMPGAIGGILAILVALVLLAVAGLQAWLARGLGMTVQHTGGGHLHVEVQKAEFPDILSAAGLIQQLMINPGATPTAAAAATTTIPANPTAPPPNPSAPPTIWRS